MSVLRKRGFYTVEVDLWRAADQVELASALVAEAIANRPKYKRLPHELKTLGGRAANTLQLMASTKLADELGQEVEVAWKPELAQRDPRRYMKFALELPQAIAEKDGKPVAVFFDEFQQVLSLDQGGTEALQKLMRAVFQSSRKVSYLFAGSIEHMIRKIFSVDQPLGHFGGFYELSPISDSDWHEGLGERFERDSCSIADDALTLLVELGELHPRATMLIAQRTHMASVAEDRKDIDGALVRFGHSEARRQERSRHQSLVERIRELGGPKTGTVALKVSRRIAQGIAPYEGVDPVERSAITRALARLKDAGIVESENRSWRIQEPLFRLYLADL
jgi:DNA-binding transcriptional ArsR family regulator